MFPLAQKTVDINDPAEKQESATRWKTFGDLSLPIKPLHVPFFPRFFFHTFDL